MMPSRRITAYAIMFFLACCCPAAAAPAGNQLNFGDSFQDANYICQSFKTMFPGSLGACSNYRNTPMQLATVSAYGFSPANDFAAGSTASGSGVFIWNGGGAVPPYPTFPYPTFPNLFGQIAYFKSLGHAISANDLVTVSYGNNDTAAYAPLHGAQLAAAVADNLKNGIDSLAKVGGRSFVLFGNVLSTDPTYQAALARQLPAALAPLSTPSTHIRILDIAAINQRIAADPTIYGISTGDCFLVAGCTTASLAAQNQYAFADQHPSDSLSLLYAKYISNLLSSSVGVRTQRELAQTQIAAASDTLMGRLDLMHAGATQGGFDLWATGLDAFGNRHGIEYSGIGAQVGLEYRAANNSALGIAITYSRPSITSHEVGTVDLDSYLLTAYASHSGAHWFADASFGGGIERFSLSRPGVIDQLTASPDGSGVNARARGAYLFGSSKIQFGPLIDFSYGSTWIDGYSEVGDSVLAQKLLGQHDQRTTGDLMFQIRKSSAGGAVPGASGSWFLNIGMEHQFAGGGGAITATGSDPVSAIPNYFQIDSQSETYGKVALGLSGEVWSGVRLSAQFSQTFLRDSGDDSSAGLSIAVRL